MADETQSSAARILACFSFAVFSLTVLPRLMSDSMFLDGVHFASVARNLAEGVGTFWAPHYTATLYPVEHEHPPLGFWLQSLAFRLFGDSPWVEALYSYSVGLVVLVLLTALWNRVRRTEPGVPHAWFVLLLFSLSPVVSHALASNLLEPAMTVFVLFAAILSYDALGTDSVWGAGMFGLAAGVSTIAAVLVKGPAGAFVAALPLCALATCSWVRVRTAIIAEGGILGGILLIAGAVFLSSDGALTFVLDHLRTQIVPSLAGLREQQPRWHVFEVLVGELGLPLLVCVVASFLLRVRPVLVGRELCAFFLLLGLAGSVPFVVSPKQPRRYLIPSLPFFLIAVSVLFSNVAVRIEQRVQTVRALRYGALAASFAILVGALCAPLVGKGIRKTDAFHTDFRHLSSTLAPRTLIQVCPAFLMQEWGLHANFQRTFKMSLTAEGHQPYYLKAVAAACEQPPSCRELLNENPQFYALYRCTGVP